MSRLILITVLLVIIASAGGFLVRYYIDYMQSLEVSRAAF